MSDEVSEGVSSAFSAAGFASAFFSSASFSFFVSAAGLASSLASSFAFGSALAAGLASSLAFGSAFGSSFFSVLSSLAAALSPLGAVLSSLAAAFSPDLSPALGFSSFVSFLASGLVSVFLSASLAAAFFGAGICLFSPLAPLMAFLSASSFTPSGSRRLALTLGPGCPDAVLILVSLNSNGLTSFLAVTVWATATGLAGAAGAGVATVFFASTGLAATGAVGFVMALTVAGFGASTFLVSGFFTSTGFLISAGFFTSTGFLTSATFGFSTYFGASTGIVFVVSKCASAFSSFIILFTVDGIGSSLRAAPLNRLSTFAYIAVLAAAFAFSAEMAVVAALACTGGVGYGFDTYDWTTGLAAAGLGAGVGTGAYGFEVTGVEAL